MFTSALIALALSGSAFANVFITSPIASTTFNGGQQCTVSWKDDGAAPTLQAFGAAMVSIYAGNSQQQTLLQTITPSVDVSTTGSIVFTPDPSIGPSTNEYFIRFQSLALKDATNAQYPALAFSAKFTMASMTGTFNASVQAQIDGQSTAPIGGTAAASSSSAVVGATTPAAATTTSSKASAAAATSAGASKTSAAAGAASTNGAGRVAGAGAAALVGVAVAILSGAF